MSPRSLVASVLLLALLSVSLALDTCAGGDSLPSVATVGTDVTVVVYVKECAISGNATARLLAAVPRDIAVWIYTFQPYTDVEDQRRLDKLVEQYENAQLVSSLPPYSTLPDTRRHALENVIHTKYFLSVENIAYFKEGFVERIYNVAETLRAEEELQHGEAKSVVFLPRMIERCDYEDTMWSRRNHQSHSQFQPRIYSSESTGRRYLSQGYLPQHSSVKFESGDNEDREWGEESGELWEQWASRTLPGKSTGVMGAHEVDFLEDHIFLGDSAFFYDHREYFSHNDLHWFEDHITQMAIIQAFGKRIIAVPDLIGYMEFFCQWKLETIHQVAWRRSDYLMARACELEEVVFGATVTYNCWEWTASIKRLMFSRIKVPDVIATDPAFTPGQHWASLRHAHLIIAFFLQASQTHFSFERRALPGEDGSLGELLHSTDWLETTEALRWIFAELGGSDGEGGALRASSDTSLYLRAKKEYVSVRSEEYIQKQKEAGVLLQPLPGAFATLPQSNNADSAFPDGKEVVTNLPDSCLYRTGEFVWENAEFQTQIQVKTRAGLVIDHFSSTASKPIVSEALFWANCFEGPFPSAEKAVAERLTTEDRVRVPSSPTDESVLVRSYMGRMQNI